MREVLDVDVAVVGAGPAGSAAAIALQQSSPALRVALIDKSRFPRPKACGDGLGPGVLAVLEQLGLFEIIEREQKVSRVLVSGPDGSTVHGELPELSGKARTGAVIPRATFDQKLFQAALDGGAEDLAGWRLVGSDISGTARTAVLTDGEKTMTLTAALLIGADGANSRVRKALGIPTNSNQHTGIAIRSYGNLVGPDGRRAEELQFDFSRELLPGYGWVFPLADGRANIGAGMIVADRLALKVSTDELLDRHINNLRGRGYVIDDVTDRRTYILPHAVGMPQLAHDRAVLIGDAASMINSLSDEGIFYGMEAGRLVASVAGAEVLDSAARLNAALVGFESAFRSRFSAHFRSCFLAQRAIRSPRVNAGIIRAAQRDPRVFENLAGLMFGEGRLGIGMVARIAAQAF